MAVNGEGQLPAKFKTLRVQVARPEMAESAEISMANPFAALHFMFYTSSYRQKL